MKKRTKIILIVLGALAIFGVLVLFILLGVWFVMATSRMARGGRMALGDKIAVIRIEGPLICGRGGISPLGGLIGSDRIISQLQRAAEDIWVKAVVIRINSPGGSAAAAQEIYQEIERVRKGGKKVVVSMGDVAASGGYYVASAADKIVANPATITGNIGVITQLVNLEDLYKKIGVQWETIKSGRYKDMGTSTRKITPEERKMLKELNDQVFNQFVSAVAQGRRKDKLEIQKIADGRILSGEQAQKFGLIDELGNFRSAIDLAKKVANIRGRPIIVDYSKVTFFEMFFGDFSDTLGEVFSKSFMKEKMFF